MAKKIWLITSLIISIISVVYIVLAYYGILRYVKLHYTDTEEYTKKYKNLPKADKERVIVTFTITPDITNRLGSFANTGLGIDIKPFLNSILDQTVRVDEIILHMPSIYIDNNFVAGIGLNRNQSKVLSIYGIEKDYDKNACLVPSILTETNSNTKIIIVDPKMVYSQEFVADMVDASNSNPNNIIYGKDNDIKCGVLVKPKFFTNKIVDYKGQNCTDCIKNYANAGKTIIGCSKTYKNFK